MKGKISFVDRQGRTCFVDSAHFYNRLDMERQLNRYCDVSERMDAHAEDYWDLQAALMREACDRYGIDQPHWLEIKP